MFDRQGIKFIHFNNSFIQFNNRISIIQRAVSDGNITKMWKESTEKDKIDKVEKKRDIRHVLQDWIPKF